MPAEGALHRPRLAVVLPVLDGAVTLPRCLAALAAALPEGAEVIVVDDGSTDDTAAVAAAHAHGMPLRVLRHPENRGTSAARNTGWRATTAPLVAFVDADMVLHPGALLALTQAVEADPTLLGANGTVSLDPAGELGPLGVVTDFVNASLHWQLRQHGRRVNAAFTAICLLRREALEAMGGWDERWFSRYADDIATRWTLPPGSLAAIPEAHGAHDKRVPLRGLVKHRINIGAFFVSSVLANRRRARADNVVLDLRYPLNTAAAAATAGGAGLALVLGPFGLLLAPLAAAPVGIHVAANARFCAFLLRERGPMAAAAALPLSILEGYALGAGMVVGALRAARRVAQPEPSDG